MINRIEVDTFFRPMGLGMSVPILVMGDDFENYILKNENKDRLNFNCMFLNELLAYQIGVYLGIPMPEAVIANVNSLFVLEDPRVRFSCRVEPGLYFASKELEGIENNLCDNVQELVSMGKKYANRTWSVFFNKIDNKESIANIIAFDILISNFDRYDNEGNVLVSARDTRQIFAIDHGHAFGGPTWDVEKLNRMKSCFSEQNYINMFVMSAKQCSGRIFRALCQHVDLTELDKNPFAIVVDKIESISEELINTWLNNIPIEWYIDKKFQSEIYIKYILTQKRFVRQIIQQMAKSELFDNYLGGELEWLKEYQLNTV